MASRSSPWKCLALAVAVAVATCAADGPAEAVTAGGYEHYRGHDGEGPYWEKVGCSLQDLKP